MFTTPAPAAPTISTSSSQASPSSPTRASRLRGLHYLRTYTHNHLHSHASSSALNAAVTLPPVTRSRSQPRNSSSIPRGDTPVTLAEPPSANVHLTTPEPTSVLRGSSAGNTAGWLPAVGARSSTSWILARGDSSSARASGIVTATGPETEGSVRDSDPMRAMTRNRAETAVGAPTPAAVASQGRSSSAATRTISAPDVQVHEPSHGKANGNSLPTIRFTPHQDARSNRQSLVFPSISRTLPSPTTVIRVGRYSERDSTTGYANEPAPGTPSSAPVGFKSKVVSRRHCEFWCSNGQWHIKDVGSSSGTFLNHIRLSQPGVESKPYVVSDGDVVQLGIDFRGGEEMIFRCVKIRVECNRGWQKGLNNFNKSTHKRLKNLAKSKPKVDGDNASTHTSECSICLMSIAPCQSLFVAPCSHVWHYKCIRPILNGSTWPNFLCPNCRAVADLEADVDEGEADWSDDEDLVAEAEMKKAIEQSLQDSKEAPSSITRPDGGGELVQSPDSMDPRERLGTTLAAPLDLDLPASAILGRISSIVGHDGRIASYGQGSQDAGRDEGSMRTSRQQRSAVSSRSARSQPTQQNAPTGETTTLDPAELSHLVSNMGITAPSRTPPPPPPPTSAGLPSTTQPRQSSSGSLPIPISGSGGGAGAVSRSSHDSSRHGSRRVSNRVDSTPAADGGSRVISQPAVSTTNSAANVDNDTTMQMDFSDDEGAASGGVDVGFGASESRPRFHRANTPSALSPVSLSSGERRGSEQHEVRNGAEIGDPDFPMTPRNDAGPFILDGSGGRT